MRQIEKILSEIAEKDGLLFQSLAEGWILKVGSHFITGYHFDINNAASSRLCDDKSATYECLQLAEIPAIPHYFFMPENGEETLNSAQLHQLKDMLKAQQELVLKPNQGSGGKDVLRVTTESKLLATAIEFAAKMPFLAVSPFYRIGQEYRVIVLRQEVQLIYSKVIQKGWKFNLGQGARPEIIEGRPELEALAKKAAEALNINFASIDIVEVEGEFKILEVNSGVMMEYFSSESEENYQLAKEIYRKTLF